MSFPEAYYAGMAAAALVGDSINQGSYARLVCKSTVEEDEGKTIRIDNGTTAYTGKFGSDLKCVFDVPGKESYKIQVINTSGVTEYDTEVDLNWGDYKVIECGLTTKNWRGIKNIIDAHLEQKYFAVGDEFEVQLTTGETMYYRVAAINHDASHQVIFEPHYGMQTARQMNSSNTNAGGWNSCAMRTYLNDVYFKLLPSELQNVITERSFKTSVGSQSSSLQVANDKIWLPREYEIFGGTSYAASTEHSTGGAEQFPIYADAANRVKTYGKTGSTANWWLSSPSVSVSSDFCRVNASGAANYSNASGAHAACPCFQIVAAA